MSEPVEASALKDLFDKFLKLLGDDFKWMESGEVESDDGRKASFEIVGIRDTVEDSGRGGKIVKAEVSNGHTLEMKIFDSAEEEDRCDVYILGDARDKVEELDVPKSDFQGIVSSVLQKLYPDAFEADADDVPKEGASEDEASDGEEPPVSSSNVLQFKLTPILGSSELELSSVYCNYDASLASTILDDILGNTEFVDSLPEDEVCYAVVEDDLGYDVNEIVSLESFCDNAEQLRIVGELLSAQYYALFTLQTRTDAQWNYKPLRLLLESHIERTLTLGIADRDTVTAAIAWAAETLPTAYNEANCDRLAGVEFYMDTLSMQAYYDTSDMYDDVCDFLFEVNAIVGVDGTQCLCA